MTCLWVIGTKGVLLTLVRPHIGEKNKQRAEQDRLFEHVFLTSTEISSDMYACNLPSEVIHMASLEYVFFFNENIAEI